MKPTKELNHWIRLLHAPGVGAKRYLTLLGHFGAPAKVLEASQKKLQQAGISDKLAEAIATHDKHSASADIEWLEAGAHHHAITLEDDEYPDLLKEIENPPPVLFANGNISALKDPQLAVVGSRNPTQGGRDNAYEFSRFLAQSGITITSGLALGIDGYSHKGALDSNAPTVAVVATGLDRVYPAKHRNLARAISKQGIIVSELTIGTQVRPQHFPRRNRIISGLSAGTLVVEAALKSGSLITARYAMEQSREVFSIPGSIHNPLARGCHQLIREGAKLVENGRDILEEITPFLLGCLEKAHSKKPGPIKSSEQAIPAHRASVNNELDPEQYRVLEAIGYDPLPIDTIVVQTGLTIDTVSSILLMLELQDYIEACGGGCYTRLKPSVTS